MADPRREVVVDYTNWRGERAVRRIFPLQLSFESSEWHPETQWILEAVDIERGVIRDFAVANIHSWRTARVEAVGSLHDKYDELLDEIDNLKTRVAVMTGELNRRQSAHTAVMTPPPNAPLPETVGSDSMPATKREQGRHD